MHHNLIFLLPPYEGSWFKPGIWWSITFLHKSNCRNKMDIVKSLCFAVCHRPGAKCESMPLNELDLQRGQMDKMRFNKLKSLKVAKWRKDKWRMMKDERWMMKDDDFKLLKGFALGWMNKWTDICNCRVAFATEKNFLYWSR